MIILVINEKLNNIVYLVIGDGAAEGTLEREGEHGYDEYDFVHVDDGV